MDVLYGTAGDFIFREAAAFLKGKKALTNEEYRQIGEECRAKAFTVVATHLSCPKINQIDCHRMSRYNGISLKKGKVPGHLQFRHR